MLRTYTGHTDSVHCLATFPEDETFVSGSEDGTLRLWTKNAEASLRTFAGHTGPVTCVATFADGTFVSGSLDKTIRLWDKMTGDTIRTFTYHTKGVTCLATYPDGTFLSGSNDKTLRLWNKATGGAIQTYVGHTTSIICIATFPDGNFVTGAMVGRQFCDTIRFWDKVSGNSTTFRPLGIVHDIITFPDNTFIVACEDKDEDDIIVGKVMSWRTDSQHPIDTYSGHDEADVNCIAHLPPRNGQNRFITGGCDDNMHIWTVGHLVPTRSYEAGNDCFNAIVSFPSGEVVVATQSDEELFLWSTEPETRSVPAGASNLITGEDIVDGNVMVNLVRQTDPTLLTNYNAGDVFYKDSDRMRALTVHPISRRALGPGNFRSYIAQVDPTTNTVATPATTSRHRQSRKSRKSRRSNRTRRPRRI